MLLSGPEGKKTFQPVFFYAYFFSHVPWLSECWCSHTWECFKSPDTPTAPFWMSMLCKMDGILPATGNIPNVPQWTSPKGVSGDLKHSQVWQHQHSQSHGTLVQCSVALQPNAVAEEICEKKLFTVWNGWKVFSHRDRIEALQLRPTNQKKLSASEKYALFLKEHHRDVLGKGTSPVIPKSRINEARWYVTHANQRRGDEVRIIVNCPDMWHIFSGILFWYSFWHSLGSLSGIYSDILFGLLSGIYSDNFYGILSGILSENLSGIYLTFFPASLLALYLAFYLTSFLPKYVSGISSEILSGFLSGIMSSEFLRVWGPAGNTLIRSSRWRSGGERSDPEVAVGVRRTKEEEGGKEEGGVRRSKEKEGGGRAG